MINTIGARERCRRSNKIIVGISGKEVTLIRYLRRKVTDNLANNFKIFLRIILNSIINNSPIKSADCMIKMSSWRMNHRMNLKNPFLIVKDLWDHPQQRFWRKASTLSRENRWECALAKGKVEPKWTLHLWGKLPAMKTPHSSPPAFNHLPPYQPTLQWCLALILGTILQGIQLEISWIQNF